MAAYIGGNYIGAAHTHPHPSFGYYPMFSIEDIEYLLNASRKHITGEQPKDYSIYVLALTTYDGVFAIKIKDPLKFYTNFNQKKNDLKLKLEDAYGGLKVSSGMDNFRKAFLDIIKEFDLGIGLYEATDNVSKWGELESIKGNINIKPCG